MKQFIQNLFRKPIDREAVEAYLNRLPDRIGVRWFRDGKFIIGEVITDDNKSFMTQGLSVKDFIDMVNDSVYVVYDIPKHYIDVLEQFRSYNPPMAERLKLEDASVKSAMIEMEREKQPQLV